ncbi:hypothetical protein GGS21DRAFT_485885 [Xylaria nigripes]|nr:hypothetical protein GGS21DRAFT_485885 [Xylaria nigripes]
MAWTIYSEPRVSKNGLQVLREALGKVGDMTASNTRSYPVLISIEFEKADNIRSRFIHGTDCQVGLAILDTRDLDKSCRVVDHIKMHSFVTGCPKYIHKFSKRLLDGTPIISHPADLPRKVQSLIPENRPIIIIGRGMESKIEALRNLDFRISARECALVDVFHLAQEVEQKSDNSISHSILSGNTFSHPAGNFAYLILSTVLIACLF